MYNGLKILESGESINRNIVECKLGPAAPDHAVVVRINRNIVECKLHSSFMIMTLRTNVLIETLWNVNEYLLRYSYPSSQY